LAALPTVLKFTFLPTQILEALDLLAHVDVHLALKHRDDVVDAPLDAGDAFHVAKVIEHIGVGNGDIDALEIDEVADVADRPVAHDRQDPQVVRIIEGFAQIGRVANEGAFQQAAGDTDGPVVDTGGLRRLFFTDRLVGNGLSASRNGGLRHFRRPRPQELRGGRRGQHGQAGKVTERDSKTKHVEASSSPSMPLLLGTRRQPRHGLCQLASFQRLGGGARFARAEIAWDHADGSDAMRRP
jgi:hypothetical protein